ncbi:DUF547 domain-containing protein [Gammaproteobacteria bacterium AB-CW1]|uniref:DUF547 domain-containing protein n=1 Tax=Natronospira elongata TaxID=3110268 RepID=A0AAP6JCZ3_9GAMM|nr:DUF547 domain-containing protein [Gammaproteobacteria bacterium AB-CW1]
MKSARTTPWAGVIVLALAIVAAPASATSLEKVFNDFQQILDRHLTEKDLDHDGLVTAFDYHQALAKDETMALVQQQRAALADFDPSRIDDRESFNAFWLNAYNFFMIAHILEERPDGEVVESVWDYGGRVNPFRKNVFERELFDIGGKKYSLDQMEKGILLGEEAWDKGWADARVHFAVNCASVGCPPLRAQMYTTDNVDDLYAENTRRALNTDRQLHVDGNTLMLSSLFDWYEQDYEREEGSVRDWIRKHGDERVADKLDGTNRIRYIDYDWNLNSPGNFPEFD